MMTRKDYINTAKILKDYSNAMEHDWFYDLVNDFADMFAEDNERFDRERFLLFCTFKGGN